MEQKQLEQTNSYKKQMKISLLMILAEIPSFISITISAILTGSLIVWMDFVDSFGNITRSTVVATLSNKIRKDLKYEYNYGIGKVEAITSLFCDTIVILGLLVMIVFSIMQFFSPKETSDLLIVVVGLKVISVVSDSIFLYNQHKVKKVNNSKIVKTEYMSAIAALLFDSAALISLLVVWIFRDYPIVNYLSPLLGILIAIYLLYNCVKRIINAVRDLIDKTLPEDLQFKILGVLNKYYDEYEDFTSVKSRESGTTVYVDLYISFDPNKEYSKIKDLQTNIQNDLLELIPNCLVTIVIN